MYCRSLVGMYVSMYGSILCFIDPPAITVMNVTEVCTNDSTVSWTAASNEEGISYDVTLLPLNISVNPMMNTSYNFTGLMPATDYVVSIFSRINTCSGISTTTNLSTLSVEAGVPQSELTVMLCSFGLRVTYLIK